MAQKLRDWIVVNIDNPGFTPSDFKIVGLTAEDTRLLPFESYLTNPIITENQNFKDDNGNFSKDKFKTYYDNMALGYLKFSLTYDTFLYDLFDPHRKIDSEIKNPNFELTQVSNPTHRTTGILGRNMDHEGPLSNKELAQQSKIYDPVTGTYSELSLDQQSLFSDPIAFFKNLFSDPIVYATYDSDGTHIDPITKREVLHKKGEFRVNNDGEYFTERLAGKNIRGKEVVSIFDNITSDLSGINKYDFFDADGLDKSITGSIFSAAATVAPLFIPGAGEYYAGVLVARELLKSLPMLSGMLDSFLGTDLQNTSTINWISGKAESLTGGTSKYSLEHALSIENLSRLAADVATQWGLQKFIAKSLSKLTGSEKMMQEAAINAELFYRNSASRVATSLEAAVAGGKIGAKELESQLTKMIGTKSLNSINEALKSGAWKESALGTAAFKKFIEPAKAAAEKMNDIGKDASLAYMAIISNTDVYNDLLDHGTTKFEASLFALGSTLGMFTFDKYTKLGEVFFDEIKLKDKYVARNIGEMLAPWRGSFEGKSAKEIINEGKKFGRQYVDKYISDLKYHSTGFLGKALGEGLEEMGEELVTDFTKSLYETFGKLGITSQKDVGSFDNASVRYGMSFLGGAMGGSIFYGVGLANGQYPIKPGNEDILYHIRNGKTKDYLDKINDWEKKGKFGSKTLSATQFTESKDENGNTQKVYLTTDNEQDSLNHFIAERVRQSILQLDGIITGNELNMTDDELFNNMIMSLKRYLDLKDWLLDESYATNYYETYNNLVKGIVEAEQELLDATNTLDGTVNGKPLENKDQWLRDNEKTDIGRLRESNLQKLRDKRDSLIKLKNDFLNADTSFYYTRKMLFALDPDISRQFAPLKFNDWLKTTKNIDDPSSLSLLDRDSYQREFKEYLDTNAKSELGERFELFLNLELKIAPILLALEGDDEEFLENEEKLKEIFEDTYDERGNLKRSKLKEYLHAISDERFSEMLEGESQEDYDKFIQLRGKKLLTQEELNFLNQRLRKFYKIKEEAKNKIEEEIINLLQGDNVKLDPDSYRRIIEYIGTPFRYISKLVLDDFIKNTLEKLDWDDNTKIDENHDAYLVAKQKFESGEDLTEEEENLINVHNAAVLDHNKDISQLTKLLPSLLVEKIKNHIRSSLQYDENGNSNFDVIYTQVHQMIKEFNDNIENKERNKQGDIFTTVNNIAQALASRVDLSGKNSLGYINEAGEYIENKLLTALLYDPLNESSWLLSGYFNEGSEDIGLEWISNGIDINNLLKVIDILLSFNELELSERAYLSGLKTNLQEGINNGVDGNELLNAYTDYVISKQIGLWNGEDLDKNRRDLETKLEELSNLENPTKELLQEITRIKNSILIKLELEKLLGKDISEGKLNLRNVFDTNEDLQFVRKLKGIAQSANPYTKLINDIASALGLEDLSGDIERVYQIIYTQGYEEMKLTPEQRTNFEKLSEVLNIANAYLNAASKKVNILNPYGHNHTINELSKSETKLPEISENTQYIYEKESNKLIEEINLLRAIDARNAADKKERSKKVRNKFTKVKLELLEKLAPKFKFTTNDGTEVDLLEGLEKINSSLSDLVKLNLLEEILFNNFNKLLRQGYTPEQIFEKTGMYESILETDKGTSLKFDRQQSGKLDENLSYDKFTSYDRFIYLTSILALNSRDWSKHLSNEILTNNLIVPLTIQLYDSRIVTSFLSNSDLFKRALSYIQSKGLSDLTDIKVLSNSIFLSGIGGAGKTLVGAKYAIDYLTNVLGLKSEDILISGSTNDVRQNLKKVIGVGTIIDKPEDLQGSLTIIKKAIGEATYKEIKSELAALQADKSKRDFKYIKVLNNNVNKIVLNSDAITFNTDDAPELIVLDEATHISSIELQILDKWAKKGVLLIGDQSQSGYGKLGGSIDFEYNFLIRTPKLGISLRDNNLQNLLNLTLISDLLEKIKALDENLSKAEYDKLAEKIIKEEISKIKIRAYNGQSINGTLYVSSIDKDLLDKITQDKNVTVGYLGATTSSTYKTLEKLVKKGNLHLYSTVLEIQGQEFDYVVVEKNFLSELKNQLDGETSFGNKLVDWYEILRDFYTVISRAKTASIINSDWLPGTNVIDLTQATAKSILEDMDYFKELELTDLNTYLSIKLFDTEEEIPVTEEETKTEEETEKTEEETEEETEEGTEDGEDSSEESSEEGSEEGEKPKDGSNSEEEGGEEPPENPEKGGAEEEVSSETIHPEPNEEEELEEVNDTRDTDDGKTEIQLPNSKEVVKVDTQKPVTNDDEDDYIEQNIVVASNTVFPIYTDFTTLGAKRVEVRVERIEDGKSKVHYYGDWEIDLNQPTFRDTEIFLSKLGDRLRIVNGKGYLLGRDLETPMNDEDYEARIKEFNDIRGLFEQYLNYLKVALINDFAWETVGTILNGFITQSEFNELKQNVYIVAEDIDEQRDVLLGTSIGRTRDVVKVTPDGKKITTTILQKGRRDGKAVKLIARTSDGSKVVTLGVALSAESDEKLNESKANFINIIKSKINRLERLILQEKEKTSSSEEIIQNYKDTINRYLGIINSVESNMNSYADAVNNSLDSEIRVLLDVKNAVSRLLSNGLDEDNLPIEKPLSDIIKNRNIAYSRPYIYLGGLPGIDDSLIGKPVVFGSSNLLESSLRESYEQLKKGLLGGLVRMVVLSGRGVHLNDLTRETRSTIFGKEVNSEKALPVTWSELGIKMFGAFWNFRASLLKFENYLSDFLEMLKREAGISEEEFDRLSRYINKSGITTSKNVSKEDKAKARQLLLAINSFNEKLDREGVRWFRLAVGTAGKNRETPSLYIGFGTDDQKYVFLHRKKAIMFENILELVYDNIINSGILDLTQFNVKNLIEGKSDNDRKNYANIRGSIKKDKATGKFSYNKNVIGSSNDFAKIALAFVNFYKYFGLESSLREWFTLFLKKEDELTFNFSELRKLIGRGLYSENDIADMFRLMIHGTTIQSNTGKSEEKTYSPKYNFNTTDKASDAYFKNGIFLNPTMLPKDSPGYEDRSAHFAPCALEPYAFNVDATVQGQVIMATPYTEEESRERTKSLLFTTAKVNTLSELKSRLGTSITERFGQESDLIRIHLLDIENWEEIDENQTFEELLNKLYKAVINKLLRSQQDENIDKVYFINDEGKVQKLIDIFTNYQTYEKVENNVWKIVNKDGTVIRIEYEDGRMKYKEQTNASGESNEGNKVEFNRLLDDISILYNDGEITINEEDIDLSQFGYEEKTIDAGIKRIFNSIVEFLSKPLTKELFIDRFGDLLGQNESGEDHENLSKSWNEILNIYGTSDISYENEDINLIIQSIYDTVLKPICEQRLEISLDSNTYNGALEELSDLPTDNTNCVV